MLVYQAMFVVVHQACMCVEQRGAVLDLPRKQVASICHSCINPTSLNVATLQEPYELSVVGQLA